MSMFSKLVQRNDVLSVNPTVADLDITTAGSDFLWAVFCVMAATGLGTMVWGMRISRGERTFHYLSAAILGTASIAYFSLASDLGATPIQVEFLRGNNLAANGQYPTRSIWYARYIDWTITTPLLLLEILLVSGLPLSTIFAALFFDLVMIITGLIGALVESTYKWGYFTFGCVAMFYVFWVIFGPGLKSASHLGDDFKRAYLYSAAMLSFLWFLYPVAWGLADGGNVISPDGEMVFYGVLDLLAKPVFAMFHLFSLRKCDYAALRLQSGKLSDYEDVAIVPVRNTVESGKKLEEKAPLHNHNVAADRNASHADPHGIIGNEQFTASNTAGVNPGIEAAPATRQPPITQ